MSDNLELKFLGKKTDDFPALPISSKSSANIPTIHRRGIKPAVVVLLVAEIISTVTFSIRYDVLNSYHNFLGATLLGGSTAVLAQTITEQIKGSFSTNKHFKFLIWGFINGIFSKLWIDFILINYDENNLMKIIVDQVLGNPIFQLVFVIYNCIWENNDFKLGLETTYLTTLKYSLVIFPVFSILAFTVLPEHYIFPANCLVSLGWNIVLAFLT